MWLSLILIKLQNYLHIYIIYFLGKMVEVFNKFDKKIWIYTALTLLIVVILVWLFIIHKRHTNNSEQIKTEKNRVSITHFSNVYNIVKEWILLPYPEITILSDVDWKVSSLNVSQWDFVKKWKILIQINNNSEEYEQELNDIQLSIDELQLQYENLKEEYEKTDLIYLQQIKELENEIEYVENLLSESIYQNDIEWQQIRENKLEKIENEIATVQVNQWLSQQNFISDMSNLEQKIQSERNKYDIYYNKINQLIPRATIDGFVGEINISQWDSVHDWDRLLTIIKTAENPEVSTELDFDEYLLIESTTWVSIVINLKDWDQYFIQEFSWVIATRNPTINENEKYQVTVQILDFSWINIADIDSMSIVFPVESKWLRINESCINYSWNDSAFINLYDWIREWTQDIAILSRLDNQVLIDDKWLFVKNDVNSIQNDLEKSGLNLQEIDSWIENDILNLSDFHQNLQILCEN